MGLDAKQLNHLTWGAHTTGNMFTTAPMSGGLTIGVPITCMCACVYVCELQLQIIHITHFDMYYFCLIGPRQCSVAYVQCKYENITHVQYMNGICANPRHLGYNSLSVCPPFIVCTDSC